jgi:hypothetical protein
MADAAAQALRLRQKAEGILYNTPTKRVDQRTLELVEALRAGADAIETLKRLRTSAAWPAGPQRPTP